MNKDCLVPGIPEYLHQKERKEDQDFSDIEENLYRRFKEEMPIDNLMSNTHLSHKLFQLREDSYNRERYCLRKEDVLLNVDAQDEEEHFNNWGILSLKVSDMLSLPPKVLPGGGQNNPERVFTYGIKHDPIPCNYSHSIHIIFCNGQIHDGKKPSSLKSVLRDHLMLCAKVVKSYTPM